MVVNASTHAPAVTVEPSVPIRRIDAADLKAALREGYADFMEKRGDLIFVGLVYPFFGIPACIAVAGSSLPMLFPLAAGVSLLGPLLATGYYELARRREAGLEAGWQHFGDAFRGPQRDDILAVGALLIGIFILWMLAAALIHLSFFGDTRHADLGVFLRDIFTTARGWGMIVVGNIVGLGFALLVLAVSIVSMPMLVDRRVDAGTAVRVSLAAFRENKGVLIRWGILVAVLLALGSIPMFIGLAAVVPILAYASWHLYTRLVDSRRLPPV